MNRSKSSGWHWRIHWAISCRAQSLKRRILANEWTQIIYLSDAQFNMRCENRCWCKDKRQSSYSVAIPVECFQVPKAEPLITLELDKIDNILQMEAEHNRALHGSVEIVNSLCSNVAATVYRAESYGKSVLVTEKQERCSGNGKLTKSSSLKRTDQTRSNRCATNWI
jgi:hypothetical protein